MNGRAPDPEQAAQQGPQPALRPSPRGQRKPSRLGGVPTTLGPPASIERQLALPLLDDANDTGDSEGGASRSQRRHDVISGAVHVERWLDIDAQRQLVEQFRAWSEPPAGLRHPRVPSGYLMGVQSVCLGWHWQPYAYSRTAGDTDGAPVKPLPTSLAELGRAAVAATYGDHSDEAATYWPDAAIVNLYAPDVTMGLHQDGEELSGAPVVTLSLGDTCVFRMAGIDRRTAPFTDITLRSGDLLVFGRNNRRIYHGVPKVLAGTAPDDLGLPPGRVSITLRETGLDERRLAPRPAR